MGVHRWEAAGWEAAEWLQGWWMGAAWAAVGCEAAGRVAASYETTVTHRSTAPSMAMRDLLQASLAASLSLTESESFVNALHFVHDGRGHLMV